MGLSRAALRSLTCQSSTINQPQYLEISRTVPFPKFHLLNGVQLQRKARDEQYFVPKFRDIFGRIRQRLTSPESVAWQELDLYPGCVFVTLPANATFRSLLCRIYVFALPSYIVPFVCPSIRLVRTQWPHCSWRLTHSSIMPGLPGSISLLRPWNFPNRNVQINVIYHPRHHRNPIISYRLI